MFVFFTFHKKCIIKNFSSFKDIPEYKISWLRVDGRKFCIHLISLVIHHFGMAEAAGLKKIHDVEVTFSGMTSLPNFMKIYQLVQTLLVWEAQSGRQTAW
jgi:hypothetical protein